MHISIYWNKMCLTVINYPYNNNNNNNDNLYGAVKRPYNYRGPMARTIQIWKP